MEKAKRREHPAWLFLLGVQQSQTNPMLFLSSDNAQVRKGKYRSVCN
jgi:hypothetical protein